jgi:hypothetical protein
MKMPIEIMFATLGIIATTITTTMVVYGKITALEVAIAKLQVTTSNYEVRIASLERALLDLKKIT